MRQGFYFLFDFATNMQGTDGSQNLRIIGPLHVGAFSIDPAFTARVRSRRTNKKPNDYRLVFDISVVRRTGIEPVRGCPRQILSLLRLPVPPPSRKAVVLHR